MGDDKSLRFPTADCYAEQIPKERRWLPQLAAALPVPIPTPLAMGSPDLGYPWAWSVNGWIEGETATADRIVDMAHFGETLGDFLCALHRVEVSGAPTPGAHNFQRGASPRHYDVETRRSIERLRGEVDATRALEMWETACASEWSRPPVWIHGDFASSNLLVRDGRLAAVIDFGCCATGDPACDLTIAWTLLDPPGRRSFRERAALDDATWHRARGWALWKALVTLVEAAGTGQSDPVAHRTVRALFTDG